MRALLIGEAWGFNEAQFKHPFVGKSGQELARMGGESDLFPNLTIECKNCGQEYPFGYCKCGKFNPVSFLEMVKFWAKTRSAGVGVTNVFQEHPERDNIKLFFGGREDDVCLDVPPYQMGSSRLWLRKSHRHYLESLVVEIQSLRPNILILLGNTACWAVLGQTGITKIRGTVMDTRLGIKAIPTFHPAALRDWKLRPTILSDLKKANGESRSQSISRPKTWILTYPNLSEIESWFTIPAQIMSCDIESGTALFSKSDLGWMKKKAPKAYGILTQLISMVGFARGESEGLVIPLLTRNAANGELIPFWPDPLDEIRAWKWINHGLSTGARLVFQNGMYDVNRLLCSGMRPKNMAEDTMLLHHALFPEMPKGLGYLDSIYRNDSPWKRQFQSEGLKRDD